MRIVALLTIRNEELYLPVTLEHLWRQGIEVCLVDNGSTDSSLEIAHSFLGNGVIQICQMEFNGVYEWAKLLEHKEKLASEIQADWFIHHDADEIREAPQQYKTLAEGIEEVDRLGYNAINFDEFVFLPTKDTDSFEHTNFINEMKYYYFFEPAPLSRVNAWKNLKIPVDLRSKGGHQVIFDGRKVFPDNFILRHYIGLSKQAIQKKYGERIFSTYEVNQLGWHRKRAMFKPDQLVLPYSDDLCRVNGKFWDKSNPVKHHSFLG